MLEALFTLNVKVQHCWLQCNWYGPIYCVNVNVTIGTVLTLTLVLAQTRSVTVIKARNIHPNTLIWLTVILLINVDFVTIPI